MPDADQHATSRSHDRAHEPRARMASRAEQSRVSEALLDQRIIIPRGYALP